MPWRRDDVLREAINLLDDVGMDGITIRRLAERLDVQPGALYRHFASKRALLDAMVEHIAAGAGDEIPAEDDLDWADRVRAVAVGMRTGMLAHRDGARLLATFAEPGPTALAGWERFTGVLRAAGATEVAAMVAVDTILCYVNGFTIEEQSRTEPDGGRSARDERFRAGLDLIIAGIRQALALV
jgi:TetR/AcrR family tetracycline transcriptional repressor